MVMPNGVNGINVPGNRRRMNNTNKRRKKSKLPVSDLSEDERPEAPQHRSGGNEPSSD